MAKALIGHVGTGNDLRLVSEIVRLRGRIVELEAALALARATSEAFAASVTVEDDLSTLTLEHSEPALT